MNSFQQFSQNKHKNKKNRHNDWICEVCKNYNYSFRTECNRCHVAPRKPFTNIQKNQFKQNKPHKSFRQQDIYMKTNYIQHNFPNCVFLILSEQCSAEEYKMEKEKWDLWENLSNNKWISKIIQ